MDLLLLILRLFDRDGAFEKSTAKGERERRQGNTDSCSSRHMWLRSPWSYGRMGGSFCKLLSPLRISAESVCCSYSEESAIIEISRDLCSGIDGLCGRRRFPPYSDARMTVPYQAFYSACLSIEESAVSYSTT